MKQAVEKNPLLLNQLPENLRGNKDLALAAMIGANGVLTMKFNFKRFLPIGEESREWRSHQFWLQFGEGIRQQLRTHDAFVGLVLGSLHFSASKLSNLAVLDHGGEATMMARNKLIAEYAGVPMGENLTKLRLARKHLAANGIRWSD